MGQVTEHHYYAAGAGTNGQGSEILMCEYDAAGNVTAESYNKSGVAELTTYAYDELGRVRQYVQGTLAQGGVSVEYTYDGVDRVTSQKIK